MVKRFWVEFEIYIMKLIHWGQVFIHKQFMSIILKFSKICVAFTCTWWRHQMETFSALLAICAGNSPVLGELPHKGQRRRALIFYLICFWINGWINNRQAGDLRCYSAHYYYVTLMRWKLSCYISCSKLWPASMCWEQFVFQVLHYHICSEGKANIYSGPPLGNENTTCLHADIIIRKCFQHYLPFVWGESPDKS